MKIVKLEPSKHVAERWLVWLEDGSLLRVTEGEVLSFSLYAGMELSGETYDELSAQAGRSEARVKALDYLSAKPMSRRELTDKLTARPRNKEKEPLCTPELAGEVCDWLEELGYLDDRAYASLVVRHYSAKGWGERKVRDELFRRGVPRELWDEAMEEARPPEEGIDTFLARRFRGTTPDQKELKKASDALARRGYRWEDIREGLNRYGAAIDEE